MPEGDPVKSQRNPSAVPPPRFGNTFQGNVASPDEEGYGGALFLDEYSDATLVNNVLLGNIAGPGGGGLHVRDASPRLLHTTVVSNGPAGAASDAGVREGDIILRLDGKSVNDVDAFEKMVNKLPAGKSVAILVQRRGGPIFLAMKVPEPK